MHEDSGPSIAGAGVIRPQLSELVALAQSVQAWPPARLASASPSPGSRSPLRGRGMEYAESRPYLHGDDARHIDWRVTARTGRAHSKLFHPERERTTLAVCDDSAALHFGTRVRYKSVQAARVAALAAWAALRSGERVGAVGPDGVVKPCSGQRGVLRVLHAVNRWYAQVPEGGGAHLVELLRRARQLAHTGSRIIVVTEPSATAGLPEGLLADLARHNDVLLVLLVDEFEMDPPSRPLPVVLAAHRETIDLGDPSVRAEWHLRFAGQVEVLRRRCTGWGVGVLTLATDDDGQSLLHAMLSTAPGAG